MVEPLGDAAQIAHAVTVGILEGARIDLIDDACSATTPFPF